MARALVWLAIAGLIIAACSPEQPTPAHLRTATPRPIVSVTAPATPMASVSALSSIAAIDPTATLAPTPTDLFTANFVHVVLTGTIYDVSSTISHRLSDAQIEWHFAAPDLREFDGQTIAASDGTYYLRFHLRPTDEIAITASARGFLPSTARLHGAEIGQAGVRLDFGLLKANAAAPTVPGDLGMVEVRGIVYNAARGVKSPIADAQVSIVGQSVVWPDTTVQVTTTISGTFAASLELHTTDEIKITITASGFITMTLTRRAREVIKPSPLLIGLKPISQ